MGHSYAGMVITGAFDRLGKKFIKRLVYWNAFVPNPGESLNDMTPPEYISLFDQIVHKDGSVLLPFPIWREAFINDGDLELAQSTYEKLNLIHTKLLQIKFNYLKHLPRCKLANLISFAKMILHCLLACLDIRDYHKNLAYIDLYRCRKPVNLVLQNPALLARKMIEAGRD